MVYIEVHVNRQLAQLIDTVKRTPRYPDSPQLQELVDNLNSALAEFNGNLSDSDEENELST